jgi:uridine kinase
VSDARAALLRAVAAEIVGCDARRVGVDGVDGAGKTMFADELAAVVGPRAVRVSIDDFHRPRAERYARGRDSAEGFFLDSYDYDAFTKLVLASFPTYTPSIHDVVTDGATNSRTSTAADDAILIVDGIFLHRDELVARWDYSIWLEVPFEVSVKRCVARGDTIAADDPQAPSIRRYVEGQRLYLARCAPQTRATVVVDNTHLDAPRRVDTREPGSSRTNQVRASRG